MNPSECVFKQLGWSEWGPECQLWVTRQVEYDQIVEYKAEECPYCGKPADYVDDGIWPRVPGHDYWG